MVVLFTAFTLANRTITGKITTHYEIPVPGATVSVKGTKITSVADDKGLYSITVPAGKNTLVFSKVGMITDEKTLGESNKLDIVLFPEREVSIGEEYDEEVTEYETIELSSEEAVSSPPRYKSEEKSYSSAKGDKKRSLKKKSLFGSTRSISHDRKDSKTSALIVSDEITSDAGSGSVTETERQTSGQLTAGEIHDFSKWKMWGDISANELKEYSELWKIKPEQRYSIQVSTEAGNPVINAEVKLYQKDSVAWIARTDNTGKVELWLGMFDKASTKKLSVTVDYQGQTHKIKRPQQFHNGINMITISASCNIPSSADFVFVVDATGSMGDEIAYLKAEITDVIGRIKKDHKDITVNLGSVFYRDHGDSYLVRSSDLDSDISKTTKFIEEQNAGGGGDYPEAVEEGLESAINQMSWSSDARAKVIFLVLDAPPHSTPEITERLGKLTREAAKKGIRIVPVTASGINKSTEYLMHSMALATNGTYVFITDDSGIGGSHIKPSTDDYKVELLNDLLIRLANQYLITPDCESNLPEEIIAESDTAFITENIYEQDSINANKSDTTNTNETNTDVWPIKKEVIKYYPNPTQDIVNIELLGEVKEMYLADISGKILQRFDTSDQTKFVMSIGRYPSGIYFIQYLSGDKWKTGKVILRH